MSSESRPTEKLGFDDCTVPETGVALAGVAEGLAVTWETGGPTRHPELARTLGRRMTGSWRPCSPSATQTKTLHPSVPLYPTTSGGWNNSLIQHR